LRRDVAIGESFSKLELLLRSPPLSLFDMLLMTRGVWERDVPPCGLPF